MIPGRRRGLAAIAIVAALAGAWAAGAAAGVSAPGARPFGIAAASLVQAGKQLVWSVTLGGAFSPGRFRAEGRSLCLLLERPRSGLISGRLCVIGAANRSGARPRVVAQRIASDGLGLAPARAVAAQIGRPSRSAITVRFLPAVAGARYVPLRWQTLSTLLPPVCRPPTPDRRDCSETRPAQPALLRLHVPTPVACVPSGASATHSGPLGRREVALTFDDGPWNSPDPGAFLSVLEREDAVATFFEIGRQIAGYDPGARYERRMLVDGDFIGNHTWSHPMMPALSAGAQMAQLTSTQRAIEHAVGLRTCLWRPPFGAVNASVVALARSLGLLTILWDVETRDWSTPGTATIYARAVDGAHNGAIILQHFGGGPRYETLAALPREIETLRSRGYRFVTIPQMLGLRVIYR